MVFFLSVLFSGLVATAQVSYKGQLDYTPPLEQLVRGTSATYTVLINIDYVEGNEFIKGKITCSLSGIKGIVYEKKIHNTSEVPVNIVNALSNPGNGSYFVHFNLYNGSTLIGSSTTNEDYGISVDDFLKAEGASLLNYKENDKRDQLVKQIFASGKLKITNVFISQISYDDNALDELDAYVLSTKNYGTGVSSTSSEKSGNSKDDFWNEKKSSPDKTPATNQQTTAKPKAPTAEEINAGVQKQTDDFWNDKKESDKKIEQQSALRTKNTNNAFAVQDSRDNLKETTSLNETYASVEALMADFDAKMSQINDQVRTLTENSNAEWNSRVDASFNGTNDATMNEGLKLIGGIVNDAREADDRKYYKEKLEKEKEKKLKEIQETRKRMLTNIRNDLFTKFKEGSLPLSSTKVEAGTLYYFAYSYDPEQMNAEAPVLYVSNIFPISRYNDGTWPFKSTITSEIAKLSPYNEKLNGYYLSEKEASVVQQGMMDIFKKTDGVIQNLSYKGKPASKSNDQPNDFWGSGNKSTSISTDSLGRAKLRMAKGDEDFWETGQDKKKLATEKKKTDTQDDFWGTGAKPIGNPSDSEGKVKLRMAKGDEDFWETGQDKKKLATEKKAPGK
ncbi:MAG: hypothetical protein WCI92_19790 [Bacteroidota bacterium]